jgi:RimJ/RimL family protein N-acetyltransferase
MTAPFTIRTVKTDDAAAIIAFSKVLADEPDNGVSFSAASDVTFTLEEEVGIIQGYLDNPTSHWVVALDEQGTFIGHSNVHPGRRVFRHTVGLGISVAKDWRNRGVGTAIMRTLIDWCAANPQIKRLELEAFTHNERAIYVYEKLGFEREGIRRAAALKDGRFRDSIMMSMLFSRPDLEK